MQGRGRRGCTTVPAGKLSKLSQLAQIRKMEKEAAMAKPPLDALPLHDAGSHQEVSMAKVFSILTPEWPTLTLAIGAISISAQATMMFPKAIGDMIDLLATPTDTTMYDMKMISVGMIGVFSVGAVATFAHSAMLQTVGQKVGARLRKQLFRRIVSQDVAFFDQNRAGELANRLSTDVHEVAEHLVENLAKFLDCFVKSVTALGAMVFISPVLSVYSSLVIPAVVVGAAFYGKFIKRLSREHLDALATSTHIAAERFSGITTVLSFGQREVEAVRYSTVIERAYTLAKKVAIFEGGFLGTSYFIGNAALLGVLWAGSGLVFEGEMTAGQLASFCIYAGHLAAGISEISESASGFLRAQGSGARLFALLDKQPQQFSGTTTLPPDYKGVIRFEGVTFAYPGHPNAHILKDFSLTIQEGDLMAVTGRSGCGKSSLLALLLRFYEPSQGTISIDGVDIRELDLDWLRGQMGTVRQEPILFAATVAENIAYGSPSATRAEIVQACIQANVHDFISALPDGYDTVVGERGASLSGGQKQRLAIARALLTKPRILLLDEATSALDSTTEKLVFSSLHSMMATSRVTAIVVAHHLSTLAASDLVVVMDEGRMVEQGPYRELASRPGMMQQLVLAGSVHSPHGTGPPPDPPADADKATPTP